VEVYLPIAEMPVNVFVMFAVGGAVGFISGLLGIGGGFLLTPLLIFSGIPAAVAVATVTPQIVASSASGALSYWRRHAMDLKLAGVLFLAGAAGSFAGAWVFARLGRTGNLELVIALCYMVLLGTIGALMLIEASRALLRARRGGAVEARRPGMHNWVHGLPLKVRFRRSRLYVSVLPVLVLGGVIGFLGTLLGIGGGFLLVPALIYLLRVPTSIVIGTSLVQTLGTMATATVLHAVGTASVDAVLALVLMIGGVVGAQFGAQIGLKLRGEYLRAIMGLLVLAVGVRFAVSLILAPADPFSLAILTEGMP
jgi:uncharacterized membrane protein YfcA